MTRVEVSVMVETAVDFEDELIQAMRDELEGAFSEETYDGLGDDADAERERRKSVMMSVLAASVRTQRLYFVIRSAIMSSISALIFFVAVLYLGTVNVVQAVFLGISLFAASLVLSRLLDKQIIALSKRIVNYLNRHKRASEFVLKKL
ncbi:MAG: hypothetical protein NWE94_06085 [Candidatus Bathyarchaeota archaeon]|nr:hypothetical protein [Candidatus Bathyarchaeota archaeon]